MKLNEILGEGGMPASVIKDKTRVGLMTKEELNSHIKTMAAKKNISPMEQAKRLERVHAVKPGLYSSKLIESTETSKHQTYEIAKRMLIDDMDTAGKDRELVHKAWSKACKQTKHPISDADDYEALLYWFKKERDNLRRVVKK